MAALVAASTTGLPSGLHGGAAPVAALDNTPWVLPYTPPRCTVTQANAGNVAGCVLAFYDDPSTTGWGVPPAPGVGDGWVWNGTRYNGSPALTGWEATHIEANAQPVAGLRAGSLRTHAAARVLFEGFLDEISANGYRVRDASGYSFRCTSGSGGWSCPSGDPGDLSNHAWGLAVDMNAGTNPIRSYSSIDGQTACMTPIQTDFPQWVIQTAEKWGLYWGGYGWNAGCQSLDTQRTVVSRDPPHFEFRGTPRMAAAIAEYNLRNDPSARCFVAVADDGSTVERCTRTGIPQAGWRLPVDLEPPQGAVAAIVNLTATEATTHGYLTIEDCAPRSGSRATSASTYAPGDTVASMAIVPIAADGRICVYRLSAVHTIVDVFAYLGPAGDELGDPLWFRPTAPSRLTDTRLVGHCSVDACVPGPAPAQSVHHVTGDDAGRIVNLTAVDASRPTYLQIGRCDAVGGEAGFSNLNLLDASARANLAVVAPGGPGTCAYTLGSTNVIVDQLGTLDTGDGFGWELAPPRRVIDTRECTEAWCAGRPAARQVIPIDVGSDAPAVAVAVTITEGRGPGYATVASCEAIGDGSNVTTSNVNYTAGKTVTGLAISALDGGRLCVFTLASAHVVVDVQAELTLTHRVGILPIEPARLHDSRLP